MCRDAMVGRLADTLEPLAPVLSLEVLSQEVDKCLGLHGMNLVVPVTVRYHAADRLLHPFGRAHLYIYFTLVLCCIAS
jgi:hypothetical protein